MKSVLMWLGTVLLFAVMAGQAVAQGPQFIPAYPLYCQGPLTTGSPSGGETTTPFIWAHTGAGAAKPGAGQCAWADRAARGSEIKPGGGNVICDFSSAMRSVPAGKFVEIGVARDPQVNNCMHLTRYLGDVSPPFSGVPALPPFVRQSIANLTAAQINSLRHGIQVMMSRPASDPTSFAFQANIHGTYSNPTTGPETQSWNNCEHGSYFFLSWHRMYLYFFDRILRAAAGDPNLVLPYWDWTNASQRTLPLPFRQPANSSNSLYIAPPNRPSALDAGTASLGAGTVDYSVAFADTDFDSPNGSGASFGGQIASPEQFNAPHGDFESQPHDVVHVALGGLMGDPNTAAEDPIFWLHHANIDRMWNRWIAQGGGRTDASDAAWLNTRFTFYDEAGHAVYLTGSEIIDTVGQLNYRYDDDPTAMAQRFPQVKETREFAEPEPVSAAGSPESLSRGPEQTLAGSSPTAKRLGLAGATARVQVPLTKDVVDKIRTLTANNATHKVFLRVDDIRYEKANGVYYEIYVNPPAEANLNIHTAGYVGNLALFGLKPHAMAGHAPAAGPVYAEYDISRLVSAAIERQSQGLNIVLVPRGLFDAKGNPLPVATQAQATVAGVSIITH
jgi:hypothetical protein